MRGAARPVGSHRRPEAASELTQASGVVLDDLFDDLFDGEPDRRDDPEGTATDALDAREVAADGLVGAGRRPARAQARPTEAPDDVADEPGGITRSSAVWLWLWGPLLAAVLVVGFLAGMASAPVVLPLPTQARPATVLDVTGRTISTVEPPTPSEQLPADQLPDLLLRSVVAVQDPGYFSRQSLSAADLLEAGAADAFRVRRHGSTIEERYARQVGVASGSVVPSLRETSIAVRLSQRLSRRALLARYVNGLYFGNGLYGIGAAARYYFGQPLTALDPGQVALLVGIGDDPAHHNPVTSPAAAEQSRRAVLDAMREAGILTPDQALAAARQAPEARPHQQVDRPSAAPDFAALIASSLLARYGQDAVYGSALQVTTPLDLDAQAALDGSVRRLVSDPARPVLAVATDPRTGDVRALTNRSSAAAGTPQAGADGVLFARRPLGTLAGQLPTVLGDGTTASVGEVAAAFGAVAGGGSRHDLRALSRVTRPASAGEGAAVLDSADPLPAGQPLFAPDEATALTAGLRATGRRAAPDIPFALAGAEATAGSDAWFVGCVPELCVTVWIGGAGAPVTGAPGTLDASTPAGPTLPAQVVAATFAGYLEAAPGRISVPLLPAPRVGPHRSGDAVPPGSADAPHGPAAVATPEPATTPAPRASRQPQPPPSAAPSPAATSTTAPTPAPAQPSPGAGAGPAPGTGDGQPVTVAEGSPTKNG